MRTLDEALQHLGGGERLSGEVSRKGNVAAGSVAFLVGLCER